MQLFRFGLVHITRVGSVFMTLSVTLERFIAIVYPLRRASTTARASVGSKDSSKGVKILILVSTLIAVAYNIPRYKKSKIMDPLNSLKGYFEMHV